MKVAGIQRCSLVDFPGEVAVTAFTQGCNLCCPYCHNSGLITRNNATPLPDNDFWGFVDRRRAQLGAIVITGGEPCLHSDLGAFLARARQTGLKVKLDTNGTFPERLRALVEADLVDYVALDVKAPLDRYARASGITVDAAAIRASIAVVRDLAPDGEYRTTVVPALHTPQDIGAIAREVTGPRPLYLQAFQPTNAATARLRNSPACSAAYLRQCQAIAQEWVDVRLRL